MFICKFCGKVCKNQNSLSNHERLCKKNPNHKESSFVKYNKEKGCAWNKGLTKETDERVAKGANKLKLKYETGEFVAPGKGTHRTKEEKEHLSKTRKEFLLKNPDKVPYILNHHSRGDSYPEKYFKELFEINGICYEQNYYQSGYFLDFAWPFKKVYVEIDGEQHYVDKRIVEHDIKRTEKLLNDGWVCLKRIRWCEYQKLDKNSRKNLIDDILKFIK